MTTLPILKHENGAELMKINIAASHRFHLLDLAIQLEKLGHEVRFYSYVPTNRAVKFGLKKESSYSLFFIMLPFLALVKLSKAFWAVRLINMALDTYLAMFMKPCDVYIALGTVYEKSFTAAKRKFNAITILEWGSKHILEQQRILSAAPGYIKQPEYFNLRSIRGYELADYIAIASDHVRQSFIDRGVPAQKLIQNPYGVSLSMFQPTKLVDNRAYDLIMVGSWCYRKGCDLLEKVCRQHNFSLLHVGLIADLPFPSGPGFEHVDPVDQTQLISYYAQARVFVLPSREEGLAMVQLQAVVCGLPVVCSKDTGGRDLKKYLEDDSWLVEMKEFSEEELADCIKLSLSKSQTQVGHRFYAGKVSDKLSWSSYGHRYDNFLSKFKKLELGANNE